MGLGDKATALALAVYPIEKDAADGPQSIDILARIAARMENPGAP